MGADSVSLPSGTCIKETCADMDRETVVSSLLRSMSKEKRDRDQNVVQTLKTFNISTKSLIGKAELAVRGEKLAQQRLYEAESDVEVKQWKRRNSDTAHFEINHEFESQRSQLQQAD